MNEPQLYFMTPVSPDERKALIMKGVRKVAVTDGINTVIFTVTEELIYRTDDWQEHLLNRWRDRPASEGDDFEEMREKAWMYDQLNK